MSNEIGNKQIILLTEGAYYPNTVLRSNKTLDLLSSLGLISTDGKSLKPKFVGLIFVNGRIIIAFPKTWNTTNYNIRDVPTLILTILKYQRNIQIGITDDPEDSDLGLMNNQIKAAFWLIFDYLENGILVKRKEVLENGGFARTSWNRTVKKTNPWFTRSGPIYLSPIQKTYIGDWLSEISFIHQAAVTLSCKWYGWLVESEVGELQEIIDEDIGVEEYWETKIESELAGTFIEREQLVLKNIKSLLFENYDEQISNQVGGVYTTNTFNLWETLCSYAFDNEYSNLAYLFPKPKWNWDNRLIQGDEQIPDILYFYNLNKDLYLLDAKYYTAPRDLPGVQDIVKQLFYELTIRKNFTDATRPRINNIFVFPGMSGPTLQKRGDVSLDNVSNVGRVINITLDVRHIMEHYIGKNVINYRKLLHDTLLGMQLVST